MLTNLPQDILLYVLSFLEPHYDQICLALCSKTLFELVIPFIQVLCLPCSIASTTNACGVASFCRHSLFSVGLSTNFNPNALEIPHEISSVEFNSEVKSRPKVESEDSQVKRNRPRCHSESTLPLPPPPLPIAMRESVFFSTEPETDGSFLMGSLCIDIQIPSSQQSSQKDLRSVHIEMKPVPRAVGGEDNLDNLSSSPFVRECKQTAVEKDRERIAVFQANHILRIAPKLTSLRSLTLSHPSLWRCDTTALNYCISQVSQSEHLVYLDFSYCSDFDPDSLLCGSFPALQSLTLDHCYQVQDAHLQVLAKLSITHLSLKGCKISGTNLHELKSLLHLDISRCEAITDEAVSSLSCLNLCSLSLRDCHQRSLKGTGLHLLQSIESLDLCGCCCLSSESIAQCKDLQRLKRIDLSGLFHLSKESICRLVNGTYKTLESISMQWCSNADNDVVLAICRNCPQLKHLDLRGTAMNDEGIESLVDEQSLIKRTLQSLRVSSSELSSRALSQAIPLLENVKFLGVENCIRVDDCVINAISQLRKLRGLSLYGCDQFGFDSFFHLIQSQPLEWVDIRLCWQMQCLSNEIPSWTQNVVQAMLDRSNGANMNQSMSLLLYDTMGRTRVFRKEIMHLTQIGADVIPPLDDMREYSHLPQDQDFMTRDINTNSIDCSATLDDQIETNSSENQDFLPLEELPSSISLIGNHSSAFDSSLIFNYSRSQVISHTSRQIQAHNPPRSVSFDSNAMNSRSQSTGFRQKLFKFMRNRFKKSSR